MGVNIADVDEADVAEADVAEAGVAEAVAKLAVCNLPGVSTGPIDVASLDAPVVTLFDAAQWAHVAAFVRHAVLAGQLIGLSDHERADLERRVRVVAGSTLATHAALIDAVTRLRTQGIDPVVLKGCATGYLDHERPHDRFTSDVDLLVAPGTLTSVLAAGLGTPRAFLRQRWQRDHAKSTTVRDRHATEIDVHQRLSETYAGLRIPHHELTAVLEGFEVGGVELHALDRPGRLLHGAVHAGASERVALHSLRDVPQLVLSADTDWEQTVWRAERWGIELTVAAGVLRAWSAFPLPEHPVVTWAERVTGDRRQRIARWTDDHIRTGGKLSPLAALPPHRWPGFLGPRFFPSRAFLDSQGVSWTGRARRGARRMLHQLEGQ